MFRNIAISRAFCCSAQYNFHVALGIIEMKYPLGNMKAATDLTKSGKLLEATALIQRMLSKNAQPDPADFKAAPWQQPKLSSIGQGQKAADAEVATRVADSRVSEPRVRNEQGQFESKQFSCALGQRPYKLFTPSGYLGQPLPLIIMLHGCTQTPDDFAAGTKMNELGEQRGFFVAYPAQPSSANASRCWNWFNSADQQKDRGEPALIAGIVREIMAHHAVDPKRVYVAGLSAGGAMAAVLGMTYPDLFAAIGVHSGLPCGAAKDVVSAFTVMKRGACHAVVSRAVQPVPTIVFHGDRDRTVNPANADDVLEQFDPAGTSAQYETTFEKSAMGLSYAKSVHANDQGTATFEKWLVHGAGHAWSGGSSHGSYTEPRGPDASREMIRFFFEHRLAT